MNDLTNGYTLGYVDGVERERKRIIKLLEEWFEDGDNAQEPTSKLFALIKGEANE